MFYCIVNNHDCPNKDCAPFPSLPPKITSVDSYFKRCRILLKAHVHPRCIARPVLQ